MSSGGRRGTTRSALLGSARRAVTGACVALGAVGCLALVGMMATMVYTVVAGQLGAPLLGDSEIVELLGAIAVFCFLPYCHLRGANIMIDLFTQRLPPAVNDWLDALMNVVFAVVVAVLGWRLVVGGLAVWARQSRSMFLELPQWWGYAFGGLAMLLWFIVCLLVSAEKIASAQRDRGNAASGVPSTGA